VCFHGAKGGTGTSVVAAATAVLAAERSPTLLVDLAGDQPMVFGVDRQGPTLSTWLHAASPHPDALARLETDIASDLGLLAVDGGGCLPAPERMRTLAQVLRAQARTVVVDLGRLSQVGIPLVQAADRALLVTRPCYLALRAAMLGPRADGVVLIGERGRALGRAEVAAALGIPVVVQLWRDPAVARAVDAGLLDARLPRSLRPLGALL
jgi:MinD-like ATPase involved in chromosome partitioning or flagellar assembly